MEARMYERLDPETPIYGCIELTHEVTGEFLNREDFMLKNISLNGVNLLSNYSPLIGNIYPVLIHYGGDKHAFTLRIVHSRILRFQDRPEGIFRPGVVYATGCQFIFDNEFQKKLISVIIQNECGISPVDVIA